MTFRISHPCAFDILATELKATDLGEHLHLGSYVLPVLLVLSITGLVHVCFVRVL